MYSCSYLNRKNGSNYSSQGNYRIKSLRDTIRWRHVTLGQKAASEVAAGFSG